MNARDAVTHADDRAYFLDRSGLLVILDLFAQNLTDFICLDVRHAGSVAPAETSANHRLPAGAPNSFLFRRESRAQTIQAVAQRPVVNGCRARKPFRRLRSDPS